MNHLTFARRRTARPAQCRAPRPHAPRRAFSLIDAIAAVVIISLVVPASVVAMSDASVQRAASVRLTQARWLASEKLEDILADRASATRGYTSIASANYPSESTISSFPGFSRSVTITENGPTLSGGGTGYKTVVVRVSWVAPRSGTQTLSLSTVVTSYTP